MFQEHRTHRLTERFRRWGIVAWASIGILLLLAAAWWAFMQISHVFPPLVLALVTIYLLNPLVTRLERRGVPRIAGTCFTYVLLIGVVAVGLVYLVPLLVQQTQGFVQDFPTTVDRVTEFTDSVTAALRERFPTFDVGQWLSRRTETLGENLGGVGRFLLGAVQTVALLFIGPIIAFYLLVDLPRLRRSTIRLIPPHRREEVQQIASDVGRAMGGFFRGQLFVALIVGVLSSIAMLIIGLPYWLVVGMIAGFFNIIPLIGPYIGAIPGILIAAAFRSPLTMLWVALAMTVVQQIDNHFISPNVMRLTVRLHPATVMVALIAGATVAGFWGMLLAVPVTASVKLVAAHFWRTRVPWGHDVFEIEPPPSVPADVPPTASSPAHETGDVRTAIAEERPQEAERGDEPAGVPPGTAGGAREPG